MVEASLKGLHILIAEDNATNQLVVSKMIEQLGGTFDMASDGLEAIALFDSREFDLALLDIEMPRKSGLEVIRHIRASKRAGDGFPLIALTAFVLNEHRKKIMAAGANGIIAKPIMDIQKFGEEILLHSGTVGSRKESEPAPVDGGTLANLAETLGPAAYADLLVNLRTDLERIETHLREGHEADDEERIRKALHSLLSLGGIVGAQDLIANTQNLQTHIGALSSADRGAALDDILAGIEGIQGYIADQA